jgi:hypothetical protein
MTLLIAIDLFPILLVEEFYGTRYQSVAPFPSLMWDVAFGEAPSRGVAPRFVSFPPKFSRGHPASPRPPPALKLGLVSQTKVLGG